MKDETKIIGIAERKRLQQRAADEDLLHASDTTDRSRNIKKSLFQFLTFYVFFLFWSSLYTFAFFFFRTTLEKEEVEMYSGSISKLVGFLKFLTIFFCFFNCF